MGLLGCGHVGTIHTIFWVTSPELLSKARLQQAHVSYQLEHMNFFGGSQVGTPPARYGSETCWIRFVAVGFGGGRRLSTGGALDAAALDELAGCSFVEPALFFADKSLTASGALICESVLDVGTFTGPKMLYGGALSSSLSPQG